VVPYHHFGADPPSELDGDDQVAKIGEILRQIPLFKRQLLYDLITLLTRVSVFAEVNLMDPQNLATIFGGMGDIVTSILNATERTDFTRFMIENYETLFEVRQDFRLTHPLPDKLPHRIC